VIDPENEVAVTEVIDANVEVPAIRGPG